MYVSVQEINFGFSLVFGITVIVVIAVAPCCSVESRIHHVSLEAASTEFDCWLWMASSSDGVCVYVIVLSAHACRPMF